MKLYRSHLKPLALALAILSVLIIAAGLPLMRFFPGRSPGISPLYILARCVLGLLSAAVAWFTACRNRHYRTAFILSAALLAAAVTLTILFGGNKLDDLTDIMTLMMLLLAYTLLRANQSERRWKRILARKGTVLDLKIGSRDDLFNPIVLAPHLEINGAVVDAVDHYLATAGKNAPLTLCLHCAERIPLRGRRAPGQQLSQKPLLAGHFPAAAQHRRADRLGALYAPVQHEHAVAGARQFRRLQPLADRQHLFRALGGAGLPRTDPHRQARGDPVPVTGPHGLSKIRCISAAAFFLAL